MFTIKPRERKKEKLILERILLENFMKKRMIILFLFCSFLTAYPQDKVNGKEVENGVFENYQQKSSTYSPPAVPETFEQEKNAVQVRINELFKALIDKEIDKILELCNEQAGYREKFEENIDNLSNMAASLKSAKLTHLAGGYDSFDERVGQVTVEVGSKSFALPIVKIKGKWFFQDL